MITWNLEEAEADFILATLNGQPQNWTVMSRAGLIKKLMQQIKKVEAPFPFPGENTGGTDD